MEAFATIQDVIELWKPLTAEETERAEKLLPLVSDCLRAEAKRVGKDLDKMIKEEPTLASVAKVVTVDVISRVIRQNTDTEPMTQESQSAMGYSWSGTYAIAGGGIANSIMKNDLKRLGIRRQRYGVIDFYGQDTRD